MFHCCSMYLSSELHDLYINECVLLVSTPRLGSPLEKGMATHSSILAWRIPWTG